MPLVDNAWYVNFGDGSTTGYYAVTTRPQNTAVAAGVLRRQATAPAVGSERVFVCIVAGTTANVSDATWVLTRGARTTDGGATWQECTGIAALNGDATNTPSWTTIKNTAIVLGQVIQRDNGASYQICNTAGTAGSGSEPAFSNTAGTTTADNTANWTSLGAVGNFTGWQAPHARLGSAHTATWGQAGNKFYVGNSHAETVAAASTITFQGLWTSDATTTKTLCVNTAGSLPPVSADLRTTATISTTGNNALTIAGQNGGAFYCYGITFTSGSGANSVGFNIINGGNCWHLFEACATRLGGSTGGVINFGGTNQSVSDLLNTTVQFASTASGIVARSGLFRWRNTVSAVSGSSFPTTFVQDNSTGSGVYILEGVDLSALGSGKTLFASLSAYRRVWLVDCKLGASVTVASTPTGPGASRVHVVSSDSGATNYRQEVYDFRGTQSTETTIVRTSGASDGTTPISWKIVTTAATSWLAPFEAPPIAIWNDTTSAITTLTFYGTTTGGGVPKDDEILVEAAYLGSNLTPLGSFITSTKADNLAASAATNNSSDGSTWGGGGAGNGFKIVVPTFTPGQAGPINIVIKVAKTSSTYYIDPRPSISGVSVAKSFIVAPGVYANSLSSFTGSRARIASGF